MLIKAIKDEWFQDYKIPSMLVAFPFCSFKCDHDCGKQVCQNSTLALSPTIELSYSEIISRYRENPISKAIIMAGLEPFDSAEDLIELIRCFRKEDIYDPVVIYTGYKEEEIPSEQLSSLASCKPVIIKYGRYIPGQESHIDPILGVYLAGDNQYAKFLE